ncbi:MAG TPA: LPS export ABC transporter permease LptF [Chiayiivirga sp.]|nr:LPS export ABC transporter permease LptF [Chiayiivirga sp.]
MSASVRWSIIDRYLLRQLLLAFAACVIVLVLVSMGGLVADLLGKIARGKLPATLLVSQLGLRALDFLPLLLPLSLFLAVLLTYGRMYRDSEMAVLASAGLDIRRLARPLLWLAVVVAILVGATSLWLSPIALRTSQAMIDSANKSLLAAGLEPGRFVDLPGRAGVIYISQMDDNGRYFRQLFVQNERGGRVDVITAQAGELFQESQGEERYLRLKDGFRVEGERGSDAFRMMRFALNDIRLPDVEPSNVGRDEQLLSSLELLRDDQPVQQAELHWRLATPLATLILALLALPLSHSPPRSARYGRVLLALVAYIVYLNLLALGRIFLASGQVPIWAGLWWVHLPVLALAGYLLWRDARSVRKRSAA